MTGQELQVEQKKHCPRCKRDLPLDAFGANRSGKYGRSDYCRECRVAMSRKDYLANREASNIRSREYYRKHRAEILVQSHEYYLEHADEYAAKDRVRRVKARGTPEKRAAQREEQRKYRVRHPGRVSAQKRILAMVRDGLLIRPEACSRCGRTGEVHFHHEDYSKPLEVEALCRECHLEAHGKVLRIA